MTKDIFTLEMKNKWYWLNRISSELGHSITYIRINKSTFDNLSALEKSDYHHFIQTCEQYWSSHVQE